MAFHILVQIFDSTYQTNILKRILNTLTVIIGPLLVIIGMSYNSCFNFKSR